MVVIKAILLFSTPAPPSLAGPALRFSLTPREGEKGARWGKKGTLPNNYEHLQISPQTSLSFPFPSPPEPFESLAISLLESLSHLPESLDNLIASDRLLQERCLEGDPDHHPRHQPRHF